MADTKPKEAKISIKVFVDKLRKRVVYAEADHIFVDILLSLMAVPLGTIVRLLGNHADKKFEALGSLNNLYQSLNDFPESYFSTEECKFMLLNPKTLLYDHCRHLKLNIDNTDLIQNFICGNCCSKSLFFSICNKAKCLRCGYKMTHWFRSPQSNVCVGDGVFVSDIATFIVTDDLSVMPYSATGIIRLLTDLGITDTSHLEERKLDMGSEQMLYLLKMALSLDFPFTSYIFPENINVLNRLAALSQSIPDLSKKGTPTSSTIVLEVSLQKSTGKFLFAEAKEDFLDFLFGILSIPLGTVIGTLLNGCSSIKCMDNIFRSVSNMSVGRYLKSYEIKDKLLKPHFGQEYTSKNILFPLTGSFTTLKDSSSNYKLKDPRIGGAFLRQYGMFFVTDDLIINPSSSHLTISTLNEMKVKLDDIEKYDISIDLEEGLKMLKASLRSRSTLTSIIKHQLNK